MPHKDPEARRAYMREYKAANRERMRQLNNESYERHKEEIQARRSAQLESTPAEDRLAKGRAYDAAYRERNSDRLREYSRAWRAADPERQRRYRYNQRLNNPESFRGRHARYYERHPDRARALQSERSRRRHMRKQGVTLGRISYVAILARDKGICHICKRPIERKDLHFDHVIPLSKGGTHTPDNIAMSHSWCNLTKGAKLLTQPMSRA